MGYLKLPLPSDQHNKVHSFGSQKHLFVTKKKSYFIAWALTMAHSGQSHPWGCLCLSITLESLLFVVPPCE